MDIKRRLCPSRVRWLLASLFVILAPWASAAAGAGSALVRLDPPSHSLSVGDRAEFAIRVENVDGLYGMEVHVTFDPAVLQVVDADGAKDGVQMRPGDWLQKPFVAVNRVDNSAGVADFALTLVNPAPAVSGSGAIAVIAFTARANGTSSIAVQKAMLASRDAREIASRWEGAAVTVAPLTSDKERKAQESAQPLPHVGAAGLAASLALVLVIVAAARRARPRQP